MELTAEQAIEIFATASEENLLSPLRDQQVVQLPDEGEVWMTGDIHDHRQLDGDLTVAKDLYQLLIPHRRHRHYHHLLLFPSSCSSSSHVQRDHRRMVISEKSQCASGSPNARRRMGCSLLASEL